MQQEISKALAGTELKEAWAAVGAEPGGGAPEDMQRLVDLEIVKWAKVVKDSGAKID
jgi:tripartite-type tricarboxylate transporter receptor subunit TctC